MISPELAKKIRTIHISSRKAVTDILAGEYLSVFKGRGMEFDEVREYAPGDDIRSIDWNVTARSGTPYVKRYVEERELTVLFLVDLSASGSFSSIDKTKNEIAAEFTALVAFSAIRNNDRVGLIVFTDTVELFIPPAKGTSHVLRLIREILYYRPRGRKTDIGAALDYLGRIMAKSGVVFLLSDFEDQGYEKKLRILAKKHDLIAVSINDPRELELPDAGLISLLDAESGEQILLDTSDATVRQNYRRHASRKREELAAMLAKSAVDQIPLSTDRNYVTDLVHFFNRREKRQSR